MIKGSDLFIKIVRVRKDIFYLALQWCERKKIYAISLWHDLAKNTNQSQFLSRDQTLIRVPGIQSECLNRCSLKWHIFICDIALVAEWNVWVWCKCTFYLLIFFECSLNIYYILIGTAILRNLCTWMKRYFMSFPDSVF